jgi:hypothetical protein
MLAGDRGYLTGGSKPGASRWMVVVPGPTVVALRRAAPERRPPVGDPYASDVIEHDGKDLRSCAFLDHKAHVGAICCAAPRGHPGTEGGILLNEHIAEDDPNRPRNHQLGADGPWSLSNQRSRSEARIGTGLNEGV